MAALNFQITDEARKKFREFLAAEEQEGQAIYLGIQGYGPSGFQYVLDIVDPQETENVDRLDCEDFQILVDQASTEYLDGVSIDFLSRGLESGFHFENPNKRWKDPLAQTVQEVLDSQINPSVASHGGWVTLLDVKKDTAYISLGGGCQGCGMADVTLKQGIEVAILDAVPEIRSVLDTTDHAAGENPYFDPAKGGASPF